MELSEAEKSLKKMCFLNNKARKYFLVGTQNKSRNP